MLNIEATILSSLKPLLKSPQIDGPVSRPTPSLPPPNASNFLFSKRVTPASSSLDTQASSVSKAESSPGLIIGRPPPVLEQKRARLDLGTGEF